MPTKCSMDRTFYISLTKLKTPVLLPSPRSGHRRSRHLFSESYDSYGRSLLDKFSVISPTSASTSVCVPLRHSSYTRISAVGHQSRPFRNSSLSYIFVCLASPSSPLLLSLSLSLSLISSKTFPLADNQPVLHFSEAPTHSPRLCPQKISTPASGYPLGRDAATNLSILGRRYLLVDPRSAHHPSRNSAHLLSHPNSLSLIRLPSLAR